MWKVELIKEIGRFKFFYSVSDLMGNYCVVDGEVFKTNYKAEAQELADKLNGDSDD